MRLKKIKLAGFKSFVEPTTVTFPSQLVGVVGPNGCGKSNIIDAVRWVMGESSAKNLRGEAMTDVIFNGSRDRKPVGQAFVELVFDNSEGRILGEYAAYTDIAIKRLVTRDGQSNYYLNGAKCRRKDIIDVFLGTGAGSRSYSIIGQGTISRIIEAKPEEFRVYIEEAAGISKYKERRRETENRIRHTEENLSRVNDIRDELAKQLERLQRQAKAAEKFKLLKADERKYRSELEGLRWQAFEEEIAAIKKHIDSERVTLESLASRFQHVETSIEKKRLDFESLNETFNQSQATVYQIATDIARLEETIANDKQQKQKLESSLLQAQGDWSQTVEHYENAVAKLAQLEADINELTPQEETLRQQLSDTIYQLENKEKEQDSWQHDWQSYQSDAAEYSKVAHREQAEIQKLEHRLQSASERLEKLNAEMQDIDIESLRHHSQQAKATFDESDAKRQAQQLDVDKLKADLSESKQMLKAKEQQVSEISASQQSLKAKLQSLQTIQEASLGRQQSTEDKWLQSHQLAKNTRLAETLHVESGWEKALETVLGQDLKAVCLNDLSVVKEHLASINEGEFTFIDTSVAERTTTPAALPRLSDKVDTSVAVSKQFLANIFCVDTINDALSHLTAIQAHEKIITKEGILFGQGWCRVVKAKNESEGVLLREKAIKTTQKDIEKIESELSTAREALTRHEDTVLAQEESLEAAELSLTQLTNESFEFKSKMTIKDDHLNQMVGRLQAIDADKSKEKASIHDATRELDKVRDQWQQAISQMEGNAGKRQALEDKRQVIIRELNEKRDAVKQLRTSHRDVELSLKTKQSEFELARDASNREKRLSESLKERIEVLVKEKEAQANNQQGDLADKLTQMLSQHVSAEESLSAVKIQLENTKVTLSELEAERNKLSGEQNSEQQKLDDLRMKKQALEVRQLTITESLEKDEIIIEKLIESLPEEASVTVWEEELAKIASRISRLGAINLAAIDEYEVESERKTYLDEQCKDLTEALETLTAAINKIDKETKTRFRETFDDVNQRFSELFPRLFGGGSASLELTSDDLLDTGVAVMARPPGKRNSTIHLLSGGEKALTAVALVFAIFGLNPSPFCLLDEVDAPLDDSNVGRFCQLVKEMSKTVQFVVITHNKVTMEMAEQLLGVTMHEPGVSRIVSVDVEKAYAMAT